MVPKKKVKNRVNLKKKVKNLCINLDHVTDVET